MIKTKNKGILAAIRELKEIGLYNIFREEYEYRQKVKRDIRARESYVRKEGIAIGRTEGMMLGKAEGKAEAVLELLEELGDVPEELKETILKEKDYDNLSRWNKNAAKAESIVAFLQKM